MATKTVVCPACGSDTALGRYTCVECGAFLDGIAVQRPPEPASALELEPTDARSDEPAAFEELPVAADSPFDGDPDPEHVEFVEPVQSAEPPAEVDPTLPPPADRAPDVQWPPAGASAPLPVPEPRVPAGSWLPPSAHLTGLEEPATAGTAAAAAALAAPGSRAMPRDWLAALGTPEKRWAAARRTIAIGSVVSVLGYALPWASGSPGTLLNVWLQVWGLAFAGTWLVVLALVGLTALALLSGRVESVPLGVPAIAAAALELGLIWPMLFGTASRPIGVLVVLVGAIVLAVGGGLQLGARHEAATPDV